MQKGGTLKVTIVNWDDLPELLTVDEVAVILRRGKACAYALCYTPGFPAIKIGRTWRIVKQKLRDWVDDNLYNNAG